jgi:hypothetical protein
MAWQRSPRVVYEVVDGQAVLVDPEGVELLTLNAVGTQIWEALDGIREPADLTALLVGRFDGVTPDELERDITAFLAEISAAGLVDPADDPAG